MTAKLPYSTECDKPPPYTEDPNINNSAEQTEVIPKKSIDTLDQKKKDGDPELGGVSNTKCEQKNDSLFTVLDKLLSHLVFLAILCIIIYPVNWSAARSFTNSTNNLFTRTTAPSGKHFAEIDTIDDIWEYMNNQLVTGLYWDPLAKNYSDITYHNHQSDKAKFNQSRMIGQPSIRMLRARTSPCTQMDKLLRAKEPCYASYSSETEDRLLFNPVDSPAFEFTSAEALGNNDLWGVMAIYGGGGFVQYLSEKDKKESLKSIGLLMENGWIDGASRLVVIEFAVYNGRLNLFSFVKLIFELPRSGGVIPTVNINTMRLFRYVTNFDMFILICEAFFPMCAVILLVKEFIEIVRCRSEYFKQFWNYINLAIVVLSIISIKLSIQRTSLIHDRINKVLEEQANAYSFDDVIRAETYYNYCTYLLFIFAVFKAFKYIGSIINGLSAKTKVS